MLSVHTNYRNTVVARLGVNESNSTNLCHGSNLLPETV